MGLFGGYGKSAQGQVKLNGQTLRVHSPRQAINHGIALVTNDRKATGLVPSMSVIANTTLADLERLSPRGWRQIEQERKVTQELGKALRLRAASLDMDVEELSGGNQQKIVLAKWLQIQPQLLLLDEPTRGVDVGAKHEIYQLMNEWTEQGIAIMLITSEMPELLAMSDRLSRDASRRNHCGIHQRAGFGGTWCLKLPWGKQANGNGERRSHTRGGYCMKSETPSMNFTINRNGILPKPHFQMFLSPGGQSIYRAGIGHYPGVNF